MSADDRSLTPTIATTAATEAATPTTDNYVTQMYGWNKHTLQKQ